MINSKSLILFLILLNSTILISQEVLWGDEYRNIKHNDLPTDRSSYFLGTYEKNTYMLHWDSENSYVIQSYDSNMNIKETTETVTLSDYKGFSRTAMWREESIFKLGNEVYLMTNVTDKDSKLNYYLAEKFDLKTLKFTDLKELLKADYDSKEKKSYYSFEYVISPNSKKIMLSFAPINQEQYVVTHILKVFDENLNEIWNLNKKEFTKADNYNYFKIKNSTVSDNGDIYVLGQLSITENEKTHWELELIRLYENGEKTTSYRTITKWQEFNDVGISKAKLLFNEENDIIISSLFTATGFYPMGHYYLKIDFELKKLKHEKYEPFLTEKIKLVLEGGSDDPKLVKNKREYQNFNLGDVNIGSIMIADDGNVYRIERYYTKLYPENGGVVYRVRHMYVFKINQKGELNWIRKFPLDAKQYLPHSMKVHNSELHVFYSDYIKNIDLKPGKRPGDIPLGALKNCGLIVAKFNAQGNSSQTVLSSYSDSKILGGVNMFYFPKEKSQSIILLGLNPASTKRYIGKINMK